MCIFLFFLTIPAIISIILSYPLIIKGLLDNINTSLFFLFGFSIYFFIHTQKAFDKKIRHLYVLVHELTHAITGMLLFNKLRKIKIKAQSGYVCFDQKPNYITAISPYIFPVLNIILFLGFYLSPFHKKNYFNLFLFLQGFFLSFHTLNTIDVITIDQKDFKITGGKIFSITTIVAINLLIVGVICGVLMLDRYQVYVFIKNVFTFYFIILKKIFIFFLNILKLIFKHNDI